MTPTTQTTVDELYDAAVHSHQVLFTVDSIFPFTLIPDTVTLDREKLTFIHRLFIQTAKIISVRIEDILSVEADVGPIFGSLRMTSRYFVKNPTTVNWLYREDAIKMRNLIQGYIIATQEKIDCSNIETHELKQLLERLGQGLEQKK